MKIFPTFLRLNKFEQRAFHHLPYECAPDWLGDFGMVSYSNWKDLPDGLRLPAVRLAAFAQEQDFNRFFVQRYREGEQVYPHRDPMNNVGYTIIGIFGDFEGAVTNVAGETYRMNHGDVLKLPCTIDGVQGPLHSVSPVKRGTRYALILNTIE